MSGTIYGAINAGDVPVCDYSINFILGLCKYSKTSSLTKIDGPPTHSDMYDISDEIYRNYLAFKSIFGGGKHEYMGMMMADDIYLVEVRVAFVVPVSEGSYPNFPAGVDKDAKKQETAAFIKREKAIKTVEVMKELLCSLILNRIPGTVVDIRPFK